MYIDFNQIARIGKLIALLGFFLPWVTVSCSNTEILQATGWQLMTGDPQPAGPLEGMADQRQRAEESEPAVIIIAAFAVILIGLGMVGIADVDAHRHAEQLAAEMIFETGADDLLAVIEIFRADESDDGVDEERAELARHGVGAALDRLLVAAVVGIGRQRAALPARGPHRYVARRASGVRRRPGVQL